ncbi:uncharacterized protein [Rutidosis leptorrhynchoides]|uniref:uncharacterized protein n=1 Tax=Rutidosis leptorrhynchoides TaxID=125765 RepID=UPI003A98DE7A
MATPTPWCRLFAQSSMNQTMTAYKTNFVVGSSKTANLNIKDISPVLCIIKLTEREGGVVAVLDIKGTKGSVCVNGKIIKKGTTCVLNSGDEVVFGTLGNHAYIFQQLPSDDLLRTRTYVDGRDLKTQHAERRAEGVSLLASVSDLRSDLSRLKSTGQTVPRTYLGMEPRLRNQDDYLDDIEAKLERLEENVMGLKRKVDRAFITNLQQASKTSLTPMFKEEILSLIIDGRELEVSFEEFPYYLSENTKMVLIAASYIHLKYKDQVKYASELATMNPRILLSGPAGMVYFLFIFLVYHLIRLNF